MREKAPANVKEPLCSRDHRKIAIAVCRLIILNSRTKLILQVQNKIKQLTSSKVPLPSQYQKEKNVGTIAE